MMRIPYRRLVVVTAVLLAACGSMGVVQDAGPDAALGSSVDCFTGVFFGQQQQDGPSLSTGWEDHGVFGLNDAHTSATVTVGGDAAMIFDLAAVAPGVSTVLGADGQPAIAALCFSCVCTPNAFPSTLSVDAGSLVNAAGIAFLSATGTAQATTSCGDASTHATFWAVCQDAGVGASAQPTTSAFGISGTFTCQSAVQTASSTSLAHGGFGPNTISVTQNASHVDVQYGYGVDGGVGTTPPGALQFDVVSSNVAIGTADQKVTIGCNAVGDGGSFGKGDGGTMSVAAASLVGIGSTVVLSFTGAMGAGTGCDTATQSVVLVCQ